MRLGLYLAAAIFLFPGISSAELLIKGIEDKRVLAFLESEMLAAHALDMQDMIQVTSEAENRKFPFDRADTGPAGEEGRVTVTGERLFSKTSEDGASFYASNSGTATVTAVFSRPDGREAKKFMFQNKPDALYRFFIPASKDALLVEELNNTARAGGYHRWAYYDAAGKILFDKKYRWLPGRGSRYRILQWVYGFSKTGGVIIAYEEEFSPLPSASYPYSLGKWIVCMDRKGRELFRTGVGANLTYSFTQLLSPNGRYGRFDDLPDNYTVFDIKTGSVSRIPVKRWIFEGGPDKRRYEIFNQPPAVEDGGTMKFWVELRRLCPEAFDLRVNLKTFTIPISK